jgi:hypothetical protein
MNRAPNDISVDWQISQFRSPKVRVFSSDQIVRARPCPDMGGVGPDKKRILSVPSPARVLLPSCSTPLVVSAASNGPESTGGQSLLYIDKYSRDRISMRG